MLQNMFVVAFGTITGCDISYLRFNFINLFFYKVIFFMGHFLALKVIHLLLSTAVDKIIFKFMFMSYQKSHNCVCFC